MSDEQFIEERPEAECFVDDRHVTAEDVRAVVERMAQLNDNKTANWSPIPARPKRQSCRPA
jgi:hypothetical protein